MRKKQQPATPSDRNFDGITDKFAKNIYGTSKGRLRHELLCHYLYEHEILGNDLSGLHILDAGCGLGHMTRELVKTNAAVTAIDVSHDSIASAQSNITETVSWEVGQIQDVSQQFDIIICHAVLEWTNEPLTLLAHLLSCLPSQGKLSLSFFNAEAHRFGNLIYGNFAYTEQPERNVKTVKLNPQNPVSHIQVLEYLASQTEIRVIHQAGIRCIHDYMRDIEAQSRQYDEIFAAEKKYGTQVPYCYLGKYFHLIIEKT